MYNYSHGVLVPLFAVDFNLDVTWNSLFVLSVGQCGVLYCPARVLGTPVQVHNFCNSIHVNSKENLN